MIAFVRHRAIAVLLVVLMVFTLVTAQAGPQPTPQPVLPSQPGVQPARKVTARVVPDRIVVELLKEANQFIQAPIARARATSPPGGLPGETFRPNALLIALIAQNQMGRVDSDLGRLATLRDAALKLAAVAEKTPDNLEEIVRWAAILNEYPKLKVDPGASQAPTSLKGKFSHDEVEQLFGGCGGRRGHAIQSQLFKLTNQKTPLTREQTDKLELIAYKIVLIGDVLRELDDFVPAKRAAERPEWVRFAGDVQQAGWQLAESAGAPKPDAVKRSLTNLNDACAACHSKFHE